MPPEGESRAAVADPPAQIPRQAGQFKTVKRLTGGLKCREDFTGQFGKFYGAYRNAEWYKQEVATNEIAAKALGFRKVPDLKLAVAKTIKDYIYRGGFVFAMCSAPETFDIALAAQGVEELHEGPGALRKLETVQYFIF